MAWNEVRDARFAFTIRFLVFVFISGLFDLVLWPGVQNYNAHVCAYKKKRLSVAKGGKTMEEVFTMLKTNNELFH